MLSLNQAGKIATAQQKKVEKLKIDTKMTRERMILSMHESATKLWVAYACKKGQTEIETKIGSALFGVLLAAEVFGIKDLEKVFLKRIEELKKELK